MHCHYDIRMKMLTMIKSKKYLVVIDISFELMVYKNVKMDLIIHFIRFLVNEDVRWGLSSGLTIAWRVQRCLFVSLMKRCGRFRRCRRDFASTKLPIREHCALRIF